MKRVLAGVHAIDEALRASAKQIAVIYCAHDNDRLGDLQARARNAGVRCETLSQLELDALSKGVRHQGVVAITGEYAYADIEALVAPSSQHARPPLLLALDQITDPHNFGAIVRSAVAFDAEGIITLKDRAAPVTPVVVRASAGATERARIARVTNLARTLSTLKQQDFEIIGLDAEGTALLSDLPFSASGRVLVVGAEGDGLRRLTREHCDVLAKIDLPGPMPSLNASVAAAIALYESARARTQR